MSVTAKGEISGKLDRDDENFSFTASSYAASDDRSFSVTNVVLKQSVLRRVYDSKKKKWAMVKVMEDTEMRLDVKVERGHIYVTIYNEAGEVVVPTRDIPVK